MTKTLGTTDSLTADEALELAGAVLGKAGHAPSTDLHDDGLAGFAERFREAFAEAFFAASDLKGADFTADGEARAWAMCLRSAALGLMLTERAETVAAIVDSELDALRAQVRDGHRQYVLPQPQFVVDIPAPPAPGPMVRKVKRDRDGNIESIVDEPR